MTLSDGLSPDRPDAARAGHASLRPIAADAGGLLDRRYRSVTLGAVALVALYAFEALAVATAMPTVAQALDGLPLYALAFGGTLAASVVGMVVAGSWGDRRGPAPPLRQGIAWFAVGLVIAGLAPSMWVLLLGRIVQGLWRRNDVGGVVCRGRTRVPAAPAPAHLSASFAAAWVLPAVIGPAISGLLVEHLGWRWVFLSVPFVALGAAWCVLPALRGLDVPAATGHDAAVEQPHRIAWAVGAAASALLLHYAGQQHHAGALPLLALAVAGVIACAWQLLPRGTLRAARGLPTVIAMRGIASAAFFGTEVFVPLLLSRERGLSPTAAGAVLTAGAHRLVAGLVVAQPAVAAVHAAAAAAHRHVPDPGRRQWRGDVCRAIGADCRRRCRLDSRGLRHGCAVPDAVGTDAGTVAADTTGPQRLGPAAVRFAADRHRAGRGRFDIRRPAGARTVAGLPVRVHDLGAAGAARGVAGVTHPRPGALNAASALLGDRAAQVAARLRVVALVEEVAEVDALARQQRLEETPAVELEQPCRDLPRYSAVMPRS